jgi:hypothetical protein
MVLGSFKFHRRALAKFHELPDDERTRVLKALNTLADVPAVRWPGAQARRLPGEEPLYLVRVDDSLRLFVQATDGQAEVMDIARQETLDSFAAAARNGH